MPRAETTTLPQPIFSESNVTPDPTRFKTQHPSDSALYQQIGDLLKKDAVSFDKSRVQPSDLYALQDALGTHGPEVAQGIKNAGKIIFHAAGDTGASNEGKYGHEISVADQMTAD